MDEPMPFAVTASIDAVLARYGLRRLAEPRVVSGGAVNENFRVETDGGAHILRRHAPATAAGAIALEHRAIAWAAGRRLPVNPPCIAADGSKAQQIGGRWWTLFPWLEGRSIALDRIDARGAATLGATQGLLHAVLRDFDDPALERGIWQRWQTEDTLAELAAIEAAIQADATLGGERSPLLDGLALRRALLQRDAQPADAFADLPRQTVHGDFHERNVLIDAEGDVLAVIDWEMVRRMPPIYDLLRGLTFMQLLDSPLLADYLAAYRLHAAIDAETCERGVALWWQLRLHSTWALRSRFLDGDQRAHRFLAGEAELLRRFAEPAARAALVQRLRQQPG